MCESFRMVLFIEFDKNHICDVSDIFHILIFKTIYERITLMTIKMFECICWSNRASVLNTGNLLNVGNNKKF